MFTLLAANAEDFVDAKAVHEWAVSRLSALQTADGAELMCHVWTVGDRILCPLTVRASPRIMI